MWGALALILLAAVPTVARAEEPPDIVVFWSQGCPYCEAELAFLAEVAPDHPDITIALYEVKYDAANRDLFAATMAALGREIEGVPTTIIGGYVIVGFNEQRAAIILGLIEAIEASQPPPVVEERGEIVDIPFVGEVDMGSRSLLTATALIALVDGFNPCSLWVLSLLLAIVLNSGSRRRVLAVGIVFLTITALMYGIYIAGMYSVLSYIAFVDWIRIGVALVAATFGVLNVKEYFAFGAGPSLTIAERHKPSIYRRIRSVGDPDRSLLPVLGGTALLAVGVSLVETPCTAGFPVLWADLLARNEVGFAAAAVLFGVYMLVFLADELLVLVGAVVAMRVTKITETHGRVLKLVGGMVMLALAAVLIAAPELMESVSGALTVFVVAAMLTAAVLAFDRLLRPKRRAGTPTVNRR